MLSCAVVEKAHSTLSLQLRCLQLQPPGGTQPVSSTKAWSSPWVSAPEESSGETQPRDPEETGGR